MFRAVREHNGHKRFYKWVRRIDRDAFIAADSVHNRLCVKNEASKIEHQDNYQAERRNKPSKYRQERGG